MIDMVVHRHKLRETLSRLCRLLMANKERIKAQDKSKSLNGRARGNGASLDGRLIEAAARAGQGTGVDAEPVEDVERIKAAKGETRDRANRETDTAKTRGLPEDGVRGS
jgi:acetyl-CoA carboxylase carboxyl transferase subunit beta